MPEKILVSNIHEDALPSQLAEHLGLKEYGSHARIELVMDRQSGSCVGHGYVIVPVDKQKAILRQAGSVFMEQELKIVLDKDAPGGTAPGWRPPIKRVVVPPTTDPLKSKATNRKVICKRAKHYSPPMPSTSSGKNTKSPLDVKPLHDSICEIDYTESPNRTLEDIKEEIVSIEESIDGEEDMEGVSEVIMVKDDCLCCPDEQDSDSGLDYHSVNGCHGDGDDPIDISQESIEFLCTISNEEKALQKQKTMDSSAHQQKPSPRQPSLSQASQPSQHQPRQVLLHQPHQPLQRHVQREIVHQHRPHPPAANNNVHQHRPHPPMGNNQQNNVSYRYPSIDVGAILTHSKFRGDIDDVVQRARAVGVETIIATGLNINMSIDAGKLAQRYSGYIYSAVGIHPHEARRWNPRSLADLENLALQPWCVGIGECGLDYFRNYSPREKQLEAFEKQVVLACRLRKPLILHVRNAHEDFTKVLSRHYNNLPPTLIHCFTGHRQEALQYIGMGFYIGITGYVCKDHSSSGVRSLLQEDDLPLDKLILQTDCPYMMPYVRNASPFVTSQITQESRAIMGQIREDRSEPCVLPLLAEVVAALMRKPPLEVAIASRDNATRLFSFFPTD